MGPQLRWMVILGGYFGYQIVQGIARNYPRVAPYLLPLMLLYVLFVYLTWTGQTLFNLLLRLDPFGRLVLTPRQMQVSNLVGGMLLLALVAVGGGFLLGAALGIVSGLYLALMVIPVAHTLTREPGRNRMLLLSYTAGLAAVALLALGAMSAGMPVARSLTDLFLFGILAFSFIANVLR